MITFPNRIFISLLCALFLIAAICCAYWQDLYLLSIPIILLLIVYLLQHPVYLFYLLILSIPWSVEFNFNPNLGTDLPDEPLMLLASLSFFIYLVYRHKKIKFYEWHPLIVIIALQFVWAIITVITSTDIVASSKYLLAKGWYLLAFLFLPVSLFKNEKILKRSAVLLLCSVMTVMVIALIRHGQNGWSFEKVNNSVRPFFRNHVNYSALLVFMLPVQIAVLNLFSLKKIRLLLFGMLVITIAAIYFSYARGAWLALIAGLVAYWLTKKKLLFFGFLFFFCTVIAGIFWLKSNDRLVKLSVDYKSTIFHSDFKEHLIATYQLKDLSNAERLYRWIAGVRMIKDSWKTGFGPSTFYHQYKSYTLPAFKTYVSKNREQSTVHNYFLLVLIEQGVLGCFLFIFLLATLFWYIQKIYHRANDRFWKIVIMATASILAMECVVNFLSDMIETDKVGSVFYLCIATIIIADIKTNKSSDLSTNVESIS